MDCQKIKEYLCPFLDGQLDSQRSLLVKEHLSNCPLCALELKEEKRIDSLIRQNIPTEKASFTLKEMMLKRIKGFQRAKVSPFAFLQLKPALVAILAILLVTVAIFTVIKKTESFPLFSESILNHIKFLQGTLPIEVASDNPQEIKNWFQGKLSFAIITPDLSQKGVNLIGGRLCHLRGREVAYLIYEKNGQRISVFVIDTKGFTIPKAKKITLDKKIFFIKNDKGYQSILCLKEGSDIGCIFVSDLPADELIKILT